MQNKDKLKSLPHIVHRCEWVVDLNVKADLPEQKQYKNLHDLGLSKDFLDVNPKAQHAKLLSRRVDSHAYENISVYHCQH